MTPLRQRMINAMQMRGCGLRLSEVLAVRVADIDSSLDGQSDSNVRQ